jgi:hypothetical protein
VKLNVCFDEWPNVIDVTPVEHPTDTPSLVLQPAQFKRVKRVMREFRSVQTMLRKKAGI